MKFAHLLEELLKEKHITQKELATRAGLTPGYINHLLKGTRTTPSEGTVTALSNALELDAPHLTLLFEAAGLAPGLAVSSPSPRKSRDDWGNAPNVRMFQGREAELNELQKWIGPDRCQLICILGMGGIGKTMLAAKAAELFQDNFDYVFWRSLQHFPGVESLLKDFFALIAPQQRYDPTRPIAERSLLLVEYLRKYRCLIILDNYESILQPGTVAGQYQATFEEYSTLLQSIGDIKHESCLLITSREKPRELPRLEGKHRPVRSMDLKGISPQEAQTILQDEGLVGSPADWNEFVTFCSGNPLVLKLTSEPIRELFAGSIQAFLQEREGASGDIYTLLDQHFQRLSRLEQRIIYWLAIEREAISLQDLHQDLLPTISRGELLEALTSLRRRAMIEQGEGAARFSLPSVILEYAIERFLHAVSKEVLLEQPDLLLSHALMKAQAKDYIRAIQRSNLLAPLANRLLSELGKEGSERILRRLLDQLRAMPLQHPGYGAGNILNLLVQLRLDLKGYDFSHLVIRQAYLQYVDLREVNFAHADLSTSTFKDSFSSIFAIALSADSSRLAAGTASGEVRLWNTTNTELIHTFRGHTEWVRSVAFSPDNALVASGSDDSTIRLWNSASKTCQHVLEGHSGTVYAVAFSPAGDLLASGSDDSTIRLWDVQSGTCLRVLHGHNKRIYSVAFHPTGATLVSGGEDRMVHLWDVQSGSSQLQMEGHESRVRSVAFSANGTLIASGGEDQTVRLWQASQGTCLHVLRGHDDRVWSVAFHPQHGIVASGSDDHTIRLWNTTTGKQIKLIKEEESRVYSIAFSADGTTIASGGDGQIIHLWDADSGKSLKTWQGYGNRIFSVAFSPDGQALVGGSEDRTVRIWNVQNGEPLKILSDHTHWVWSIAFSPDRVTLASGSEDWTVRLWNSQSGECLRVLTGHEYRVYAVAFHPNGTLLASSSGDQTIRLWDTSSGACLQVLKEHSRRVRTVAFHPNGELLVSGSDDRTIRVWHIASGSCIRVLQGHSGRVRTLALHPNGDLLASGSDDQTIRLWQLESGECIRTLAEHHKMIYSVAFHPDGELLASSSEDQSIRLWHPQTGACIRRIDTQEGIVYCVAFSPDGTMVASGNTNGLINLWTLPDWQQRMILRSRRPYEAMNITGVTGLTDEQKAMLKALGARENE